MSDSNKDSKKAGFFSSLGFLAAGMAVAAGAYFLAKPVHQLETTTKEAVTETKVVESTTVENTLNLQNSHEHKSEGHVGEAHAVIQVPEKNITANDTTPMPAAYQSDAQIFFAVSQSTLSVDAQKSLAVVVDKMKANTTTKAFLSGYTDATGNKIQNELLAKERAKSVRNFLRKAGVNDARIEMLKPETLVGSSNTNIARRVEVTVK
ncbi:MAG: cytochrome c oxidase subunit [Pseudomonadota bacterium]|jgi:outer membrane protein OmpA-like peptidoglycan-associated protein